MIEDNNLEDSLILGDSGNDLKLTEVIVNGKKYYTNIDNLEFQLENPVVEGNIALFGNFPAINAGLRGVIIGIDDKKISDMKDLGNILSEYNVGDEVTITTKEGNEILEFDLVLSEYPNDPGRAIMGINLVTRSNERILGKITEFFNFFKEEGTKYEPKFNPELILFIYNLIWWLALINLSVALVNMWPVAIFDGGRFFMLTVWAITGSEKFAMRAFKLVTYLILASLALLMVGWFLAIF